MRKAILASQTGQVQVMVKQLSENKKWVVLEILDKDVTAYTNIFWYKLGGFSKAELTTYAKNGKTIVLASQEINEEHLIMQ